MAQEGYLILMVWSISKFFASQSAGIKGQLIVTADFSACSLYIFTFYQALT